MNTSEYNTSLQPGEKPLGSGSGVPAKTDIPDGKTYASRGEWAAARMARRPAIFKGNAGAHAAMSEVIRQGIAQAEANPEPTAEPVSTPEGQPEAQKNDGLNYRDPWDEPGAVQQVDPNDAFAPYRAGQGVPLEMPASVTNFSEEDAANLSDFGFVAAREGWPREFAQALVEQAAAEFRTEKNRPGPEGYDPLRTVSELRWEFGAETEAVLARVEAYCARRPALSAYLDGTGLGNSPSVLRMLAAVSSDESIVTKAGAKKFVDELSKNTAYWNGSKLEVAKSRIAFMLADGK
jgi:hypothetical protein